MRQVITIYFVLTSLVSFGQNDSTGVFIPSDDASPLIGQRRYMWVGMKNPIAPNWLVHAFIRVWTDNGVVDSGEYYCIRPIRTGNVSVFCIQQTWNGKKYDTVETKNTFKAIMRPSISLKVLKDNFKKDSTITISLIDSLTLKPVDKRYQVGRMFQPIVYDHLGNYIGEVILCFGTTIDFANEMHRELKVRSGYKIKIRLLVRDMKTDLLIPTNELVYTIK